MGTPMTLPAVFAPGRAAPVMPLMAFLAGGHAEAIARLWPAPHAEFFALPAARRHSAAILAGRAAMPDARIQWLAARAKDGELAAELFGPGPPGGLMKALGRMGEVLWTAEQYARFLDLFGEEAACGLIRHMKVLRPESLSVMARLPPLLRRASIVAHLGTDDAATDDLAGAWDMALRVHGAAAGAGIAQRLSRANSPATLFQMARAVIQPVAFGPAAPPPELPPPFVAVRCFEVLSGTALEFRNCLRDFVAELAAGRMAVYVWRSPGGQAAVALRSDPAGWRLAEARGRDNADLPAETLMAIVAGVTAAGVRTGESWASLQRRLDDRTYEPPAQDAQDAQADLWKARLALGNLWD
jgi:hypothetical protein